MGQTYIRESPGGGCAARRIGARACARHDHVVTQQLCAGRSASRRYFVAVHLQLFFSLRGLSALSTVLSTLPGHSERVALVFRLASRPPAFLTPPLSVEVYLRLYSSVSMALVPSLRSLDSSRALRASGPRVSSGEPPARISHTSTSRTSVSPPLPSPTPAYSGNADGYPRGSRHSRRAIHARAALVASGEAAAPG